MKILNGYSNQNGFLEEGDLIGQDGEVYNALYPEKHENYYTVEKYATAISRTMRYLGNSKMTVAQHCVRGADCFLLMGEKELAYTFLFHEVSEPFGVSDISTPVKRLLGDKIKKIEENIESKLANKFGYIYPFPEKIKIIDKNLAIDEMTMMAYNIDEIDFEYWDYEEAFNQWMFMYKKLKIYKDYY